MANNLYLRLERAKKIQHVMERLGVEPDNLYAATIRGDYELLPHINYIRPYFIDAMPDIPTWRKDKLEAILPIPVELYQRIKPPTEESLAVVDLYTTRLGYLRDLRGQEALDAVSDLICLLDENGLMPEGEKCVNKTR